MYFHVDQIDPCCWKKQASSMITGIEGKKEVLGLYLSESEGANFWLSSNSERGL
ncbi:hypothetical protein YI89_003126 [Salmonella enterica subsp. enterica]|nr:hypothetical protein [Salmonella enterica subsp. enterica]